MVDMCATHKFLIISKVILRIEPRFLYCNRKIDFESVIQLTFGNLFFPELANGTRTTRHLRIQYKMGH